MKHAASVSRANAPKLPEDATEEEFEAWLQSIPPCPNILSVDDDAEGDAASLAEFAATGGVPHAVIAEWLKTWGTPDRRSFWDWYASRHG